MTDAPPMVVDGDPIALLNFVERECGADAYTFDGDEIVALKRDVNGNDVVLKRYKYTMRRRS